MDVSPYRIELNDVLAVPKNISIILYARVCTFSLGIFKEVFVDAGLPYRGWDENKENC
jgi:hypothetical protein